MDRYLVISSDCHAGLPPERYRDYLDPRHRDAFDAALPIQIAATEEAAQKFLVADINEEWRKGCGDQLSGAWDHDMRIQVLDNDGIAGEVIFPDGITEMNMPPFGAGISLPTEEVVPELQWAGARAHNRWLAELCQMAPERRAGIAIVPVCWDVDEAVREARWAKENGLRGVMLPVRWGKQDAYHHPKYDPFWAACEEMELVVNFHSGPAPMEDYGEGQGMVGIYISEVVWWLVRPLTFMLWGGVFERFPRLRVAITEGTAVWVPEYLQLLDFRYEDTPYSAKLGDYTSHLSMKPSEYFARNVLIGASCMPRREAEMRHQIGVDKIAWGSDYPHPEGTWPNTVENMKETFRQLPQDEIKKMLGQNALNWYGFEADKLAPTVARVGPKPTDFQ
ncbi:MAG TPA: amidohydrolase [Myxococcales bacterium]|nr:amidohydrolase [Myxococcales bacterium]HIL80718.1 amidohydrolase [Myxococcales bacterium]